MCFGVVVVREILEYPWREKDFWFYFFGIRGRTFFSSRTNRKRSWGRDLRRVWGKRTVEKGTFFTPFFPPLTLPIKNGPNTERIGPPKKPSGNRRIVIGVPTLH